MAKKLLIIGAGNVGGYISYNVAEFGDYEIIGFLDDDPKKQGLTIYGYSVLGTIQNIDQFVSAETLYIAVGIAEPTVKKKIISILENNKKIEFPNLIAENAWISNKVDLGKGLIIYPGVSVNYETYIGDFVIMNMNCAIGHNCIISKYSTLAPGVNLGGFTKIDEGVNLGIGVSTRQSVSIGKNTTVGGQAMVIKDVPANSKVKGIPAAIY